MKPIIAIASGKGGTGKTTVAVNLAAVSEEPVLLADCDVEEPNCHLFIHPEEKATHPFGVLTPAFNLEKCVGCGRCRDVCRFQALIMVKGKPMLFPENCHACGGCSRHCPARAITEVERPAGTIHQGDAGAIRLVYGLLDIGEAKSPPLIREVRRRLNDRTTAAERTVIIDAPPGTSCPVVSAIDGVDYLVLVTESTPFGLHDLQLAVEMARTMGLPFGVIINRAGLGDSRVREYCQREGIAVLMELPFDREVAQVYADGKLPARELPAMGEAFQGLWKRLREEVTP
ncbi:P-loop NTPase [Heliobacterium undosum]|uniref:P-loop NTPase n=1 Tax=Heliomicrobium undosum TaxID=121734 RepID=A0A845L2D7_9FIRM|nr:ATP-binding protein [Heliomicrobium undosum]MZP29165.1 P-loop NTPase [Heliomicrobium undosum]